MGPGLLPSCVKSSKSVKDTEASDEEEDSNSAEDETVLTFNVDWCCIERVNLDITLIARASDFALKPANESDLHKRFPNIFPHFWHNRDSEQLVVDADNLDRTKHYLCIEIPIDHSSSPHQDEGDDDEVIDKVSSSKRVKTSSPTVREVMNVYIPHYRAELYRLASVAKHLKDSARHPRVLLGFIISVLGGILHMSYPPSVDECKLYCEVIVLYEHYGLPIGEIASTFAHVINSLILPQPITIPPYTQFLADMYEFVWVMCSQNHTCLSLLAPLLSIKENTVSVATRIGALMTLNPTLFVELMQWKWEKDCWKLPNCQWALPDIYPQSSDRYGSRTDPMDMLKQHLQESNEFHFNGIAFKVFDKIDDTVVLPSYFFSITSSVADSNGVKSGMRRLVHKELLVEQWPYFRSLIESGLSESKSQLVELPFCDLAIELLLKLLYYPYWCKMSRETALELIELGPQFGLFDALKYEENCIILRIRCRHSHA